MQYLLVIEKIVTYLELLACHYKKGILDVFCMHRKRGCPVWSILDSKCISGYCLKNCIIQINHLTLFDHRCYGSDIYQHIGNGMNYRQS